MKKIVFLERDTLPARAFCFDFPHSYQEWQFSTASQITERIADADIAIVNKVRLGADEMDKAPNLKLIALTATGYDNVDIQAARQRGIAVCNVRGYGSESVAQHALMLMLNLMRNLPAYTRDIKAGAWQKSPHFTHFSAPISDVQGKTLAIFGHGNIGGMLANYAQALGMNVLWGEHKHAENVREGYTAFQTALSVADAISLHCPLNAQTKHLIGEAELKLMKPQAVLINVGRGGLADEAAVAAALKQGKLGGAGFDVLSQEPPINGSPLLADIPNLIVTPHVAWAGDRALEKMVQGVEGNINSFVAGYPQNLL